MGCDELSGLWTLRLSRMWRLVRWVCGQMYATPSSERSAACPLRTRLWTRRSTASANCARGATKAHRNSPDCDGLPEPAAGYRFMCGFYLQDVRLFSCWTDFIHPKEDNKGYDTETVTARIAGFIEQTLASYRRYKSLLVPWLGTD